MRLPPPRRGMTLIEFLAVLAIVSTLSLMSASRFTILSERSALRSARQQVEAAIATARASAIQKGRNSTFYVSGNRIGVRTVIIDAGATTNTLQAIALDSSLKVSLELHGGADTALTFNSRGYASPRFTSVGRYVLMRGSRRDSTCVSVIGHIIGQGCVQ